MAELSEKTEGILARIKDIPTLPAVVNEILETISNPDSSADDLTAIIEHDQALASKMLKLVNSSFYGMSGHINTVARAVVVLGFSTIKQLALGVSVINTMSGTKNKAMDPARFWEHSLITATAGQLLSQLMQPPVANSLFTMGLLHDIGKVIEAQYMEDEFARALDEAGNGGCTLLEAERRHLGADHTMIGERICERWRFPAEISHAVRYHHGPLEDGDMPEGLRHAVRGVYLSNQAAHVIEDGALENPLERIDLQVLAKVGVQESDATGWLEQTRAQAREVISLFR